MSRSSSLHVFDLTFFGGKGCQYRSIMIRLILHSDLPQNKYARKFVQYGDDKYNESIYRDTYNGKGDEIRGGGFRDINLMKRNRFLLPEQLQEPQFEQGLQIVDKIIFRVIRPRLTKVGL